MTRFDYGQLYLSPLTLQFMGQFTFPWWLKPRRVPCAKFPERKGSGAQSDWKVGAPLPEAALLNSVLERC